MANKIFVKIIAHFMVFVAVLAFPLLLIASLLHALLRILAPKTRKSISNDLAVITGGAHGVGKAFAELLAKKGCHICIVDINKELGEKVAEEIAKKYNVKAKAYKTDVSSLEQIEAMHEQIRNEFGKTTILINNAGILCFTNLVNPDPVEVQKMINVNFTAHYWMNRVFLPDMKEQKRGYIVATCSMAGTIPLVFNAEYTGTKFGVRGHMRALRQDLLFYGYNDIICTTVQPYFLTTNDSVLDMVNAVAMENVYPLVSGEEVAQIAIDGMLRGDAEIFVPSVMGIIVHILEFLPSEFNTILLYKFCKLIGLMDKHKDIHLSPIK